RRESLAIDLAVDGTAGIEDRRLRHVVEAAGDRAVGEAKLLDEGRRGLGVGAGDMPAVDVGQVVGAGKGGKLRRTVAACVEPEGEDVETVLSQRVPRLLHLVAQIARGQGADG